jgi:3-hydroxy-3-methylglutaryl CoA synthase
LQTIYTPDKTIDKAYIASLYEESRKKYSRSLAEAKKAVKEEQKDVVSKIESFAEPII